MKIYQKRSLVALYLLGCVGVVILGLFLLYINYNYPETLSIRYKILLPVAGWLSIVFFGIIGIPVITMSFIKPKLVLEISDEGFYSHNWGYVEWENVCEIALSSVRDTKIIMFNIKDMSDKNKLRQESNKLLTGYNFDITLSGTGANIEEVYNTMLKHIKTASI